MIAMSKRCNAIFCLIVVICYTAANPVDEDNKNAGDATISLVPTSISSLACISMVILLCLGLRSFFSKFCPDNSFKDLETDDAFFNDIAISTVPASFPMYPPVVNSTSAITAGYNTEQVYFEPLPDLSHRHKSRPSNWSNLGQVRPKIAKLRMDRKESLGEEDYLFDAETRRTIEKIFGSSKIPFPRSQLQYIKELGSGWFGKVLQGEAYDIQPGKKKTKVMVMMLKEGVSNMDKSFFLQEAFAYREIENANVLKMFFQCVETTPLLTILEFCQNGDLKSFMLSQKGQMEQLSCQNTQLNMLCDVAAGLQCLHQYNFVHRDLAMRNCLVGADLGIKIGDYGLADQLFKEDYYLDQGGVPIPVRWMAPESLSMSDVVKVNATTREANIWTFGVVMWELLRCGDLPYPDLNNLHVIRLVSERATKPTKPNVGVDNITYLWEVMEMCWRYEPSDRPSIREIRIMLLHLLSNKHQADLDFFEEKWNQLKPKPISVSESQISFSDLQRPENRHSNLREEELSPLQLEPVSSGAGAVKSFPILAPLDKERSLAEELSMSESKYGGSPEKISRRIPNSTEEDAKSNASQLTGTEDGFEIVSVGGLGESHRRAEDSVSADRDRFTFVQREDVDFSEGDTSGVERSYEMRREDRPEHPDKSRSPARPNFVDLGTPGSSSLLSVTPSDRSDSRNLMDEFSPMAPLSDSSLLKMDKYTNYLCTAVTSIENDDSFFDGSRTKTSSEVSLTESSIGLK